MTLLAPFLRSQRFYLYPRQALNPFLSVVLVGSHPTKLPELGLELFQRDFSEVDEYFLNRRFRHLLLRDVGPKFAEKLLESLAGLFFAPS